MTEDKGYADKKICKCTVCGKDVEVTKFATPDKVKCPECKESGAKRPYLGWGDTSNLEGANYPEWSDVKDRELRNIACLSCGTPIPHPYALTDSTEWGQILRLQCPHCFLTYTISEQSRKFKWRQMRRPIDFYCPPERENAEVLKDEGSGSDGDSSHTTPVPNPRQ